MIQRVLFSVGAVTSIVSRCAVASAFSRSVISSSSPLLCCSEPATVVLNHRRRYQSSKTSSSSIKSPTAAKKRNGASVEVTSSTTTPLKKLGIILAADDGMRLDRYVTLEFGVVTKNPSSSSTTTTEIPKDLLAKLIRQKRFRVQSKDGSFYEGHATGTFRLKTGDTVLFEEGVEVLLPRKGGGGGSGVMTSDPTLLLPTPKRAGASSLQAVAAVIPLPPYKEPSWLRSCVKYVDRDVVVITKPAGIASQPGGGGGGNNHNTSSLNTSDIDDIDDTKNTTTTTIMNADASSLNYHLDALAKSAVLYSTPPSIAATSAAAAAAAACAPSTQGRLRIVHRLDKDVSGLMVLARNRESAALLSNGLANGKLRKKYIGIANVAMPGAEFFLSSTGSGSGSATRVSSLPAPPPGTSRDELGRLTGICKVPITRTEWNTKGDVVDRIEWEAETKWTAVTVPNKRPSNNSDGSSSSGFLTLFCLEPVTGRRHQLRQHVLALLGGRAGLLGDSRYRGTMGMNNVTRTTTTATTTSSTLPGTTAAADAAGQGLMLHSFHLVIPSSTFPQQKKDTRVIDELPARMRAVLQKFGVSSSIIGDLVM